MNTTANAATAPCIVAAADPYSTVLAALAHPVRRQLLDLLAEHGPATVTALATLTRQAVGNASHHLSVLAHAELITTAPERARTRRETWWQTTTILPSPVGGCNAVAALVAQLAASMRADQIAAGG